MQPHLETNKFVEWLKHQGLYSYVPDALWAQVLTGLVILFLLVLITGWIVDKVLVALAHRALSAVGRAHWSHALDRHNVFRSVGYVASLTVVLFNLTLLPLDDQYLLPFARLLQAISVFYLFKALIGLLKSWQDTYAASTQAQTRSIKSYLELAKIILWGVCAILIFSLLIDQSPLLMLSGLGAMSAVLLLVFKDTLLSLVASTQLTSNDLLRIGDWIEMPQANADGFVVDIALHTVKVENWDKTITTIPTYKLFSEAYRNWRNMFEVGARRIKRTLRINAASVRFLTPEEIQGLSRYRLLSDYLAGKRQELDEANSALGDASSVPANQRRLTNLGTFRAYALAYLEQNQELHSDMTMMVRMMEPTSEGIPIELYCFTAKTAWVEYERIQGDIFDHLLAILPELSLQLYQSPSGADFALALGRDSFGEKEQRLPH
ncbi:mechanosensitive ion channel family protein [Pusillimonas sp. CC-YST705]|uniref:Mechanosensitive ion channel family protein n=1 Tax=Mesopusillimonas faecipullorum TaxID=2755040 RepID=A0ABS8CAW8_9BURK|nr:mechanosensitive ion channel family protein [Mesopusillimonas faecipullorum]MCB5363180.1 mechanosensitive ion channel family protein [Mesopusillimonas faecipullorum]